jgi:hypothetical protein
MADFKTKLNVETESGVEITLDVTFSYSEAEPETRTDPAIDEAIYDISAVAHNIEQYPGRWSDQIEDACWEKVREEFGLAEGLEEESNAYLMEVRRESRMEMGMPF